MAACVTHTAWRASGGTLRYSSIYLRTSLSAHVCRNVPSSTIILTQKRSLFVLPFGLDIGLVGAVAYLASKLKKPDPGHVLSIFGPEPGSKESVENPGKVVSCIAHRGAGLDAPENTLEAFKYCVTHDCNIVELDVRSSKDGKLVLLHDPGLERLTGGTHISDVHIMDWESIKDIDIGLTHPNRNVWTDRIENRDVFSSYRKHFKEVHLCLLGDALDYLLENKCKVVIDVKGEDKMVISGILQTFSSRPELYESAAVTCFNPFVLYQIRRRDPKIVGALSYRPFCFSAQDYDAENGPTNLRYGDNIAVQSALRVADFAHSLLWRWSARWCSVSAVFLHKDIVSPNEVRYWRSLGVRCAGWCVNRPLEKLYWRGVLKAPYLANTLLGEPEIERKAPGTNTEDERAGPLIDKLLESERVMETGQN